MYLDYLLCFLLTGLSDEEEKEVSRIPLNETHLHNKLTAQRLNHQHPALKKLQGDCNYLPPFKEVLKPVEGEEKRLIDLGCGELSLFLGLGLLSMKLGLG